MGEARRRRLAGELARRPPVKASSGPEAMIACGIRTFNGPCYSGGEGDTMQDLVGKTAFVTGGASAKRMAIASLVPGSQSTITGMGTVVVLPG
jgi:hypothetical protein